MSASASTRPGDIRRRRSRSRDVRFAERGDAEQRADRVAGHRREGCGATFESSTHVLPPRLRQGYDARCRRSPSRPILPVRSAARRAYLRSPAPASPPSPACRRSATRRPGCGRSSTRASSPHDGVRTQSEARLGLVRIAPRSTRGIVPNAGHRALARMDDLVPEFLLATQNVDGLHARAGSRRLVELHGNIARVKCSREHRAVVAWAPPGDDLPPRCPHCGAYLRPDVVWFEETLPEDALARAEAAARRAEVMLVVGTSAEVWPAALCLATPGPPALASSRSIPRRRRCRTLPTTCCAPLPHRVAGTRRRRVAGRIRRRYRRLTARPRVAGYRRSPRSASTRSRSISSVTCAAGTGLPTTSAMREKAPRQRRMALPW